MNESEPQIMSILGEAVEYCSLEERAAFLEKACAGDADRRAHVEVLLRAYEAAGNFLQGDPPTRPPVATVDQPVSECPGDTIGSYKLLEQIGEGGFGVVFMAEQTRPVRRKVALKVLKPGMDTRQVIARFEAERQALALMDHPNIAKVHDGGSTETGRPYFVMELVRGVPITEFSDRNHLPVRQRLELFISVCQAVQHAHQKGVIHRDIKPSNVLVTLHDGVPVAKVIDFGVAKAMGQQLTERTLFTKFAQMVGTPLYMSPEQAEMSGLDVDTRTDIYALGVLLYELLTGTTPLDKERFKTAGYDEIRRIIREQEPARPSTRVSTLGAAATTVSANRQTDPPGLCRLFRGELDWIVMKCLEKDRNRRYETAASLVADVQRYLKDEPVQACPPSTWYRFCKFSRRNRREVLAAGVAAVAGMAGVTGLGVSRALIADALSEAKDLQEKLGGALGEARVEAYFHSITLAHHALVADDLGRALKLLDEECPEDLLGWEWYYLKRLCRVEPVILRDETEVNSLAFSPDGVYIAAACGDGAVKVWNIKTRKVVQTLLDAHPDAVFSVAFHPDGKHLASVGYDQRVKVWDLTTREKMFEGPCYAVHNNGTAYTVAFSPGDGRQLAAGSDDAVNVWDWTSRNDKPLHTFPGHKKPRSISVAFSRDGQRLASGSESVKLWDPKADGEPLLFPESRGVAALAFSPDGGRLAAASFGRRVDVWDTTTGRHLREVPHPGALMLGVAFSADGRRLASVGEDKIVHLWDPTTGREVLGLRGHTDMCGCVAFSPDGWRLASASKDWTIRVWDGTPLRGDEGRQEKATFTQHRGAEVWSLAVSPDGKQIASGAYGPGGPPVLIWDARTLQVDVEFSDPKGINFCVAWDPDGKRIASACHDREQLTVVVRDAQTKRLDFELPRGPEEYLAVAFSPDDKYLVTGRSNGKVEVWDARTGKLVGTLGTHERRMRVRGVAFSRKGGHLASASGDGVVKLWDATRLAEKQEARHTLDAQSRGNGLTLAFSPDGRRLVTGGEKHTAKIWDVETGQVLTTLEGHSGDVYAVAFSPDPGGRWVASAGEDSTVKVWDSHTGELLKSFRGHTGLVGTLAFLDGHTLISGSRDHTIKFWDLTPLEEAPDR